MKITLIVCGTALLICYLICESNKEVAKQNTISAAMSAQLPSSH